MLWGHEHPEITHKIPFVGAFFFLGKGSLGLSKP